MFRIISKIVSETNNENEVSLLRVQRKEDDTPKIIVKTPSSSQGIYLEMLSQGYQNIFYWVGSIISTLYRFKGYAQTQDEYSEYAKLEAKDIPAIVLIDEIDTYLHPKWQRNILKVLVEKFPKLQFVVTTHSPIVLSYLGDELNNFDAQAYLISTTNVTSITNFYGYKVSDILNNLQDVEETPIAIKEAIIKMFTQIKFKHPEALQTFEALKKLLGDEHYAIRQAQKAVQVLNA